MLNIIFKVTIFLFLICTYAYPNNSNLASSMEMSEKSLIGKVINKQGEPVINATVEVVNTLKTTKTNRKGEFIIYNLAEGKYIIKVSDEGYKTVSKDFVITSDSPTQITVEFNQTHAKMPEVEVVADKDALFSRISGAATLIEEREFKRIQPLSGNEILRRAPGIHVVDEEGLGMRVNIGIRGLDPDRSRNLLVLEDGIPVALAPYGEPEMYYSPAIDRMSGVEILKGSSQILFGPQTIGGVVNYITAAPPQEETINVKASGGEGGFASTLVSYGNTIGNTGLSVSLLNKRADNVGITSFNITDFNTKFLFALSDKSRLGVKFQLYDESSNSTYIGLNQVMYDNQEYFTHLAPDDNLDVKRYAFSLSHEHDFNENVKLKTIAYNYSTTRNWRRQDFSINSSNNNLPGNATGVIWGDTSVTGGAVFMRNSTGNRNRQFEVTGVEPKLEAKYKIGEMKNELIVGARYLYEVANEQRVNGTKFNVESGDLIESEVRTGSAISAYLQNKTFITNDLSFSYGVRYEMFDYERDIARRRFNIDGVNQIRDTILVNSSNVGSIIPGIGFNFNPHDKVSLFGGLHRGFAPPRTKDAISAVGEVYDLEAELSWNYELGIRSNIITGINFEITAFMLDFTNQIIPVSESSGGIGVGLINAGATQNTGIEGAINFDFSNILGLQKQLILFDISATYVNATFSADRFINEVNISGNRTPYSPEYFISSGLYFEMEEGFFARFTATLVGEQFGDVLNTVEASPDGRTGLIPAYSVFDATLGYKIQSWDASIFASMKNITDERYIASRRPQGIRVGLPRFITAGIDINL